MTAKPGSPFQSGRQVNGREELEGVQIESSKGPWLSDAAPQWGRLTAAEVNRHFLEFRKWKVDWIHTAEHSPSIGCWLCGLFSTFIVVAIKSQLARPIKIVLMLFEGVTADHLQSLVAEQIQAAIQVACSNL